MGSNNNFVVTCDHCDSKPAALFCHADAVFLCHACDEAVHANRIAQRHVRIPYTQCPVWAYREVKLRGRLREVGPDTSPAPAVTRNRELDIFADSDLWAHAPGSGPAGPSSVNTAQNMYQPRSLQDGSYDYCSSIPSEGSLLASTMHANLNLHEPPGTGSPAHTHTSLSMSAAANGCMGISGMGLLGSTSFTPGSAGYVPPLPLMSGSAPSVPPHPLMAADPFAPEPHLNDLPISAAAMLGDMGASAPPMFGSSAHLPMKAEGAGLHHPHAQLASMQMMHQQQHEAAQHAAAMHSMQQQQGRPSAGMPCPPSGPAMPAYNHPAHMHSVMQGGAMPGPASTQPIPMSAYSMPARASSTTFGLPSVPGMLGLGQDWVMSDPGCHLGARLSCAASEEDTHMANAQSVQLQGSLTHSLNVLGGYSPSPSCPGHHNSLAASLGGHDECAAAMHHRLAMSTTMPAPPVPQRTSFSGMQQHSLQPPSPGFPGAVQQGQAAPTLIRHTSLTQAIQQQQQAIQQQQAAIAAAAAAATAQQAAAATQPPAQASLPAPPIKPAAAAAGVATATAAKLPQPSLNPSLTTDALLAALSTAHPMPPTPSHRLGHSIHIEATPASVIEAKARALINSSSRSGQAAERVDPANLVTKLEFPDGTVKHLDHERALQLHRYRTKRNARLKAYAEGQRKIRYECRKTLADSRLRVKGRFAKTGSSDNLLGLGLGSMSRGPGSSSLERALSMEKSAAYSAFMQNARIDEEKEMSGAQPLRRKLSAGLGATSSAASPIKNSTGTGLSGLLASSNGAAAAQQLQLLRLLQAHSAAQTQQQQQALRRALSCSEMPRSMDMLMGGRPAASAALSSAAASPTPSLPSLTRMQAGSQSTDMYSSAPGVAPSSALASAMAAACRQSSAVITDQELAALGVMPNTPSAKSPGEQSEQSAESMSTHEPSTSKMLHKLGMHNDGKDSHSGHASQGHMYSQQLSAPLMQECMGMTSMNCDLHLEDVVRPSSPFGAGDLFADQQVSSMLDALLQDQYDL